MKTVSRVLSLIFLFVLISVAILPGTAGGQPAGHPRPTKEIRLGTNAKPRVLNIWFVQTNQVIMGTNVVPLSDMTNQLEHVREDVDVIAFHSGLEPSAGKPELTTQVLENITRMGIPLLVVEEDGTLAPPATDAEGGLPNLDLSTDQILKLRAGLNSAPADESAFPSLRSKMEWDDEKKAYDLRGIELGLPGQKNIWLIYEQDDAGNDIGGIRFKNKW